MKWQDINLEAGKLWVRRTLTRRGGKVALGEPKTKKSRRTVRLTAGAIAALQGHLKRQMEEKGSPNVPRPDPTTATRRKGLGCCRGVGMGAVQDKIYRRNPNCRQ